MNASARLLATAKRLFRRPIRLAIDIMLFVVLWPVLLVAGIVTVLLLRLKTRSRNALIVGLEHIIGKTVARGDTLERHGIKCYYYTKSLRRSVGKDRLRLIQSPHLLFLDIAKSLVLLMRVNPIYVEVYYQGRMGRGSDPGIYQMLLTMVLRQIGVYSAIILRGELYSYPKFTRLQKCIYRRALVDCDTILYRETYMDAILAEMRIDKAKLCFDPNKVAVSEFRSYARDADLVLFLNGFKKWRRADLAIHAMATVKERVSGAKLLLVGARSEQEHEQAMLLVRELGLSETVSVLPWTDSPRGYYEQAKVFLLPADLVYVNFSLLEAMERGVPPIVAAVDDAERIVEDGVNGFICAQDAAIIGEKIVVLLHDEPKRLRMAKAARETIERHFDDAHRMDQIIAEIDARTAGFKDRQQAAQGKLDCVKGRGT